MSTLKTHSPSLHGACSAIKPKVTRRQLRERYAPLQTVTPSEHQQTKASSTLVECPECHKSFVGASTADGAVSYNDRLRVYQLTRYAHCDHCDIIIMWDQATDREGKFRGEIISRVPDLIRNPQIVSSFLDLYPQLRGVAQITQ